MLFLMLLFLSACSFIYFYERRESAQEKHSLEPEPTEEDKIMAREMLRKQALQQLHARAAYRRAYDQRMGSPRFHRSILRPYLPIGMLCLGVLILTVIFTQAFLPVLLMGLGVICISGFACYVLNREARKAYNRNEDDEAVVAGAQDTIDDFRVPDEWIRKYL